MDGLAFRLSPDPAFYFDSHGHHRALAALRRGLSEASGFTIFSGEIGAGKTTVIRTVVRELNPTFFAVAQIVSTQLDATELLRAAAIGFGLTCAGEEPMALAAILRRFLAKLGAQGRRAVLVVDEAQNLHLDALDELAAMAMRGAPRGRGMQICLVGQPQLQEMLEAADLLAVREQVCVSCHLGPIERDEVRPYVEHRLRKVGWAGKPSFEAAAFEEIYRWTEGIPRRINSLCGRLITACPAGGAAAIAAAFVARTASVQRTEVGDAEIEPPPLPTAPIAKVLPVARAKPHAVLCVIGGLDDHVRAAALMSAMHGRDAAWAMKLVRVDADYAQALSAELFDGLLDTETVVNLASAEEPRQSRRSAEKRQFELIAAGVAPRAVVVFGWSDAVLACASAARTMGVPIMRIGRPSLVDATLSATSDGPAPIKALPDLWYASGAREVAAIECQGMPQTAIRCVGNLLIDAVQISLRSSRMARDSGARHRLVIPLSTEGARYGLVLIEERKAVGNRQSAVALLAFLRRISNSVPLVLLMRSDVESEFDRHGFQHEIFGDRLWHLRAQAYDNEIELLRNAACVLTDSLDIQEEALALRVPCLELSVHTPPAMAAVSGKTSPSHGRAGIAMQWAARSGSAGGTAGDDWPLWDGCTGDRIAEHLIAWLENRSSCNSLKLPTSSHFSTRSPPL